MSIISRQTGLLAAENWKKVYQTFRDADFTAYDFETLRKSMIDYIKLNYPEDFNDFTESSEFVALIDLIAFFGQSLAFRTDLNARENFIDTAERRDSILKLARLVSYNPKRNLPATGYLKLDSVSTSENVYDSDGVNLSNTVIDWDDSSNDNWLEQFNTVINAALVNSQAVGRPGNSKTINGVRHDEYSINSNPGALPIYRFASAVEGQRMNFEAVSASSAGQDYIYELPPNNNRAFNVLYRNDNTGNSSNNTGFFLYFKQGEIASYDFVINEMIPNNVVDINVNNINNSDVWLYSVDSLGANNELWTQVPSTSGINIIYNSESEKNLYQVTTRTNDQISLVFGDGSFSNIPQGTFRLYYRVSNGLTYRITPDELRSISINFEYISRYNRLETLTLRASLRYTVANANARETIDQIKQRAPQQYYTQNRMITGEDYNILPYTNYSNIIKAKAINRTSIGLSRYLDTLDTSGKYSSTNIFGQDGVIYAENAIRTTTFSFSSLQDVQRNIADIVQDIVASQEMRHYYYANISTSGLDPSVVRQLPQTTSVNPDKLVTGLEYTISTTGSTDFTLYGADSNTQGLKFTAVNAGTRTDAYVVQNNANVTYEFSGPVTGSNSTITARVGDILSFAVSSPGNPFWIKVVKTTGNANAVVTGTITNNGITNGTVTWNTANVAPGTYFYTSQNSTVPSGNIVIQSWGTGTVTTGLAWNLGVVGNSGCNGYFSYNRVPEPVGTSVGNQNRFLRVGCLIRFVAPSGYYFTAANSIVYGVPSKSGDDYYLWAAVVQLDGNGTNNNLGLYTNGSGPVHLNVKIPSGALVDYVIPVYKNQLPVDKVSQITGLLQSYRSFAVYYNSVLQNWEVQDPPSLRNWHLRFDYLTAQNQYQLQYRAVSFVFHSPVETNFFFNPQTRIYDSTTNSIIKDHIKILRNNSAPDVIQLVGPQNSQPYFYSVPLNRDHEWRIYKNFMASDGYVDNKSIYLSFADTNEDGVPDRPDLFDLIVAPKVNPNAKLVFFERYEGYDKFDAWKLLDNNTVISNIPNPVTVIQSINNYEVGQLFYFAITQEFRQVISTAGVKSLGSRIDNQYRVFTGRQQLNYQYRHNSAETTRIDPSNSNIIDIYILTTDYNTGYRQWLLDTSNNVTAPVVPTSTELALTFYDLNNYKAISDSIVFNSAVFKPIFGAKSESILRAKFKIVKNPNLNLSDADIKVSVIAAVNDYFSVENWDFGDTFYFSELSAYLHRILSPNIASVVIVPSDPAISFGTLYQINAEPNELIISSATVDDVEIITNITSSQLNNLSVISNRTA